MTDHRQPTELTGHDNLLAFVGASLDQGTNNTEACYPHYIDDKDLDCRSPHPNSYHDPPRRTASPTDNTISLHEAMDEDRLRLLRRSASQQTRPRHETRITKPRSKRRNGEQLRRWLSETSVDEPWTATTLASLIEVGGTSATGPSQRENKL